MINLKNMDKIGLCPFCNRQIGLPKDVKNPRCIECGQLLVIGFIGPQFLKIFMLRGTILREITKTDIDIPFMTSSKSFNQINPSGTLKEFFEQSKEYETYLLEDKNREVIGIVRLRDETKELSHKYPDRELICYISRVGIKKGCEKRGFASLIYYIVWTRIVTRENIANGLCLFFRIPKADLEYWVSQFRILQLDSHIFRISEILYHPIWKEYYIIVLDFGQARYQ